ncbi:MAG: rod shape-determining protein MreC [Niabella sp.]
MRNIFLFIRRFSVFIAFIILQAVSLYMLFSYNRFHRVKGLGVAAEVTGYFNSKYNALEDFFRMRDENKRIQKMNDSLMNLLAGNFVKTDSGQVILRDSTLTDTSFSARHFTWTSAEVVYTTVSSDKNYLQINRGSSSGITDDMGVFSADGGLVGKVVNTGRNFSEVMTLLNVMNRLSVQLKRTKNAGTLSWDGKTPTELIVNGIPITDSVKRGDTVLTGNFSLSFPPGKMVGVVSKVERESATNFFRLKIKPTANFTSLQHVFLVQNLDMAEQKQLNDATIKKVETSKPRK